MYTMKKTALWISLALSMFVLITIAAMYLTTSGKANSTQDQAFNPATAQQLADREAQYQQLIAEANARLAQSQQEQQSLQAQLDALGSNASATVDNSTITPQMAAQIAGSFLNRTDAYSVETVVTDGATIFKVTFNSGDIVYISPTGQVIAIQTAPVMNQNNSVTQNYEDEHESGSGD
jgi:hypothetical protein